VLDYESQKPFDLIIAVRPQDIDRLEHVNNLVYVRWIQEAAEAHWSKYATPSQLESILWVVIRHEIDYKYSAKFGDTAIVRTWVGKAERNTFERHTEIFRQSDMRLLAKARSLWCPIDSQRLRPMRVAPEVYRQWTMNENNL
jgi:acyl-CoA thioester hydrolase